MRRKRASLRRLKMTAFARAEGDAKKYGTIGFYAVCKPRKMPQPFNTVRLYDDRLHACGMQP